MQTKNLVLILVYTQINLIALNATAQDQTSDTKFIEVSDDYAPPMGLAFGFRHLQITDHHEKSYALDSDGPISYSEGSSALYGLKFSYDSLPSIGWGWNVGLSYLKYSKNRSGESTVPELNLSYKVSEKFKFFGGVNTWSIVKDAKTKGDYFLGMGQQIGVIFNPTPIVSFSLGYIRLVTTYRDKVNNPVELIPHQASMSIDPGYYFQPSYEMKNTEISAGGVSGEITFYF
jgi:hypothetical protein